MRSVSSIVCGWRALGDEESEAVLRATRLTPADQQIDLNCTRQGVWGLRQRITPALVARQAPVAVFLHFAMSGGTLIALAADK